MEVLSLILSATHCLFGLNQKLASFPDSENPSKIDWVFDSPSIKLHEPILSLLKGAMTNLELAFRPSSESGTSSGSGQRSLIGGLTIIPGVGVGVRILVGLGRIVSVASGIWVCRSEGVILRKVPGAVVERGVGSGKVAYEPPVPFDEEAVEFTLVAPISGKDTQEISRTIRFARKRSRFAISVFLLQRSSVHIYLK